MGKASVWIGDFGHNLGAVIHSEKHSLVVHLIWIFLNADARFRSNSLCRGTGQPVDVESDLAMRHLILFIANKATPCVGEEIVAMLQFW